MGCTDANIEYFIRENPSYIQIYSPNDSNLKDGNYF